MRRLLALLCFFVLFSFVSTTANAQVPVSSSDPVRPDISDWILVSGSNISVNVSDSVNYYLGFDMTFQNPHNLNEFVRQIRVIIPFVVVKSKASLDQNYVDAAVAYVTDGAEKTLLRDYLAKSDVVLYIRWNIELDVNRGTEKLVGENEVWFWTSAGRWTYGRNLKINKLMTSETFPGFSKYPIVVGLKYSISKQVYNSVEVPYGFILVALRATKGGK